MESFDFPHANAYVSLFTDVKNSVEVRSRIVKASTAEGTEGDAARAAVNFAFIEPRLVTSVLHLQTAILQALLAEEKGELRTRTVHSEILWALNPTHNISEAIRRFGISDSSTSILVVRVGEKRIGISIKDMTSVVDGTLSPLSELGKLTDWQSVRKIYKLNNDPVLRKPSTNEDSVINELVVSLVAMKSVMA